MMSPIELLVVLLYYRPSLGLSNSIKPKQVDMTERDLPVLHVVCRPFNPAFLGVSWARLGISGTEKNLRAEILGVDMVVVELWVVARRLC